MKKARYKKELYGLSPYTFKRKSWQVDQDYADSLSYEEQLFLAQFNDEFYAGKIKKGDPNALHNTDTLRKDCYNRNNAQMRDAMNVMGRQGDEEGLIDASLTLHLTGLDEKAIVNIIDYRKAQTIKNKGNK